MQVEAVLFFESLEQIYARVFRNINPKAALPNISVRFRKYANANSKISLSDGNLEVSISDLLESAPAPIQEALATVLLRKLFRKPADPGSLEQYRHYLNRADMRHSLHSAKKTRGRKAFRSPAGAAYDLAQIFEQLNAYYFDGALHRPALGWSLKPSLTTLGHYDPPHDAIVLSRSLDSKLAPELVVRFVMYHEMLHLQHPAENRGIRRCVHTPGFKQAERRFVEYTEAKTELKKFVEASFRLGR